MSRRGRPSTASVYGELCVFFGLGSVMAALYMHSVWPLAIFVLAAIVLLGFANGLPD